MANAPFVVNPTLTAIAVAYRNKKMIADMVMPRKVVGSTEFKYLEYNKSDKFTVPDTMVGRMGQVSEIQYGADEKTASTKDYGLSAPIPISDIDNAKGTNYDPMAHHTEMLSEVIMLDREKRVADAVANTANYANAEALSGTDLFTDTASDPLSTLLDALETPLMRPNQITTNQKVLRAIRQHPSIIKAYNGTLGDKGLVPLEFLRDLLEVDQILVGESFINTANRGQTAQYDQIWGNVIAMHYINPNARPDGDATWGLTAEFGDRIAYSKFDDSIGLRGGNRVKVGESVNEVVIAKDAGFLISNAI